MNPNMSSVRLLCCLMSSDTHGGHTHSMSENEYSAVKSSTVRMKAKRVIHTIHSISRRVLGPGLYIIIRAYPA